MVVWQKLVGLSWMLCALLGSAQAAEFSVGRADIVFPTDDWSVAELSDAGRAYGGLDPKVLASESKMFVKTSPQRGVEAVVLVQASKAGFPARYATYTRECESTKDYYAEGTTGGGMRLAHCLVVHRIYSTESLVKAMGEPWISSLQRLKGQLPQGMFEISSEYSNSNGTFLVVTAWLARALEGAPDKVDEALPKGIDASHVVWGKALSLAVRSSVNSIFGTMKFPALAFAVPSPGKGESRVAQASPQGN